MDHMAGGARPALGLSIGATNLAAVTADYSVTRKPVLTLYRQRLPEVGVPSENPRLDEPGLVITDFVDRVGDPVGLVASDGSTHRSEALVADALRALAYSATGGHALPESVAVTYPAHWGPKAVDALADALSRVAEWSDRTHPLALIPDVAATLFAVRANPGIPARGIVAVCDFGGSGSSITLVDAAGAYQPVAATVRHHEFSGDVIDQALLTAVMANISNTGSFDPSGTSAIGPLTRLRARCRVAKEQLSSSTVTTITDELPGLRGDIRLTRNELDDAIRDSLDNFMAVFEETLGRNGIRGADLVAVVSVGGGASIPAVTTMLSGRLRVPVVTTPRPQLTAAIGGALRAARGPGDTNATVLTRAASASPSAPATASALAAQAQAAEWTAHRDAEWTAHQDIDAEQPSAGPASNLMPALAWFETDDSRVMPVGTGEYPKSSGGSGNTGYTAARPSLNFDRDARPASKPSKPEPPVIPWYRLPAVVVIGTAVAVLLVAAAVAIGLSSNPATSPGPGVSTTPAPTSPAPATNGGMPSPAPATQAPAATPPQQAPPPQSMATQAPVPDAPAPPAPPAAPAPPPIPPIPAIPAIPRIPGFGQPIPRIGGIGLGGLGQVAPHGR
jgi:hypothetical protein